MSDVCYSWPVKNHYHHLILLTVLFAVALTGCGGSSSTQPSAPADSGTASNDTASTGKASNGKASNGKASAKKAQGAEASEPQKARRVRVVDGKKKPLFTIRLRAEQVVVDVYDDAEERTLRGFGSLEGKRRYKRIEGVEVAPTDDGKSVENADENESAEGVVIANVMALQRGFEIRGVDDAKLWHVRIEDDRILVNSEQAQYRLRRKDRQVSLHKGDVLVGRSRDSAKHEVVLVRNAEGDVIRRVFTDGNPIASALTAAEIPPDELAILVAELLLRVD